VAGVEAFLGLQDHRQHVEEDEDHQQDVEKSLQAALDHRRVQQLVNLFFQALGHIFILIFRLAWRPAIDQGKLRRHHTTRPALREWGRAEQGGIPCRTKWQTANTISTSTRIILSVILERRLLPWTSFFCSKPQDKNRKNASQGTKHLRSEEQDHDLSFFVQRTIHHLLSLN